MGYKIKLLGVAQMTGRGLEQRMQPCLVPDTSPLGQLSGGTNMVVLEGDAVGQIVLRGPGAGEGPTASAVMADICDLARGWQGPVFGQPASTLTAATPRMSRPPRLLSAHGAAGQTRCPGQGRRRSGRSGHLHRPDAPVRAYRTDQRRF